MGLTKQYLRFQPAGLFGVVASRTCNAAFLKPSKFVASGGTNIVTLWDLRFQRKLRVLNCESPAVTLVPNSDSTLLAVGHFNGGVSIYDLTDKSEDASPDSIVTFEGHRSEITSLCWDDSGTLLASGGKDTKVIIWDCVSESGVTKLKGHKGPITHLEFWKESNYLLSSSVDSTLRIWNTTTYDCVHTIAGNSQIWSFCTWQDDYILIGETHVRLFTLTYMSHSDEFTSFEMGTVLRNATDRRISQMKNVNDRHLIVVGPKTSEVEIFRLYSAQEAHQRFKRRLKKIPGSRDLSAEQRFPELTVHDLIRRERSVKASEGRLKSIDALEEKDNKLMILCCLSSNQMELLSSDPHAQGENATEPVTLSFDGHSELIRGISISSDKTAILTASSDAFKVWHRETLSCILTLKHKYPVVCCKFCPGDRHFIAGTTSGQLILGDMSSGKLTQVEETDENVWAIDLLANGVGFAALNDMHVQFYDFIISEGSIKFEFKNALELKDKAVCLKISANMKYIAVGLLDSTISVFYVDTHKHHLSLYGHNLPTTGIDISSDSQLLVSCAGDKTVKVWGLDFGDCHCSMLHTAGLVGCSFISETHHVVSVASDSINFYDADNHQRIQTIKGHTDAGASCMAVGGLYVVSAGRDQTIRLFSRTQEILVLSDEREREREEELQKESVVDKPELPSLQTADTEKSADKLIEALDVFREKPTASPYIAAYGAKDYKEYIYKVFSTIKSSELEQSLMLLPIAYIRQMIPAIHVVLENYPLATELAIKLLHGMMKFHMPSLSSINKDELQALSELAAMRLKELKSIVGVNMAGLKFLNNKKLENEQIQEYRELIGERKRRKSRKEKAMKRALLNIS